MVAAQPRTVAAGFPSSHGSAMLAAMSGSSLEPIALSPALPRSTTPTSIGTGSRTPPVARPSSSPPASSRSRAASSTAPCHRIVKSRSERVASVCASNTAKITGITVTPVTHTSSFERNDTG